MYLNKDELTYEEGIYPQIVSPEMWDRCQAILKTNRNCGLKRQFRGFKYKGKLFCLNCGNRMHGQYDRSKRTRNPRAVYICNSYNKPRSDRPGEHCCNKSKRVKKSLIDAALAECLDRVLGESGGVEYWQENAEQGWEEFQLRMKAERKKLEAEKAALDVRKVQAARSLLTLADAGPDIVEAAKAAYGELLQEEKALQTRLKQSADEEAEKKTFLDNYRSLWSALARGEIINLVSRITVHFEEQVRKTRRRKEQDGTYRGGQDRVWQVPVDCLVEFKSLGEGEQPTFAMFEFEQFVTTSPECKPGS